jgi:hypothetical protein
MKNLICTLFVLLAWAFPSNAQSFFITPRAGVNLSNITQTGGSLRTGLNFGVSGEYQPNAHIAAEIGMHYSMQGSRFKFANVSPEHDYLNIPVLVKYYIKGVGNGENNEGHEGFNVFAGPQLSLKMVVNKVGYTAATAGNPIDEDMTRFMGTSFVAGGEYLFNNGLVLSANLNLGLTNKAKDHFTNYGTVVTTTGSHKDFVVQFKFGYRFAVR